MAIFNSKKKTTEVKAPKVAKKSVAKAPAVISDVKGFSSDVIVRPRVTEKATILSQDGRMVYVFEVSRKADKRNVSDAIVGLYKVVPEKIAILKIPAKKSFVQGRVSKGKTGRKAYVYLKKGEKIETI